MMTKDFILQLKYLGMIPQIGHREYGFRIEDEDKSIRQVILTIDDSIFLKNQLIFQEAPDLCCQKVLMELRNETAESPIRGRVLVTAADIAHYRDSHPITKSRSKTSKRAPKEPPQLNRGH